jgi:Cu(I)/Ag(I) efflux system protein CusF
MTYTFTTAFVLAAVLSAPAAFAQQKMDDMKGMDMPKQAVPVDSMTHHASGVVEKIDSKAALVTFAHGPVATMKWPAMSMTFQLQDRSMLDKLKIGQKVSFDFLQAPKGFVVTAVR